MYFINGYHFNLTEHKITSLIQKKLREELRLMDKINFFPENLEVKNQKIILRLDLNIPLKDKVIQDDSRISMCLPFIKKLIEKNNSSFIVISYLPGHAGS